MSPKSLIQDVILSEGERKKFPLKMSLLNKMSKYRKIDNTKKYNYSEGEK